MGADAAFLARAVPEVPCLLLVRVVADLGSYDTLSTVAVPRPAGARMWGMAA